MRTVSEGDWLSYLTKSSQKKLEPKALVSPEVQLVVGETDVAKVDLEADGSQPSSPQLKGGRALRSRTSIPVKTTSEDTSTREGVSGAPKDATVKDVTENVIKETEAIKDVVPSPVASVTDGEDKSWAWDKSFDPFAFVERTLLMRGGSSRFDSMSTSELRKLALSHEVKGLVLNHLLSALQEKEVVNANSKAECMEKTAS
ncbi:hypothetical protein A2U01_0027523, partial [Trifolium medium]|nr:hypothetical protein [Trifolium medium]